jgi:thiol:disulfide interchange protein DsbD
MKNISQKSIIYLIFGIIFCINTPTFSQHKKEKSIMNTNNTIEKTKITKPIKKTSTLSLKSLKNKFAQETSIFWMLILAFFIGILTSFTPCLYPLIPITLGILQTQASKNMWRNFSLASIYVLGISFIYAILGYIAATTTIIFGQWLANPWIIGFIILIFIYLALSMFGFYEIHIPKFLTQREGIQVKGSYLYSFLFGIISGSVASPCLTPALAVILGFVAKIGNPLLGLLIMWIFSLGMGILLIVIGTFSTSLSALPKSGTWLLETKKLLGFVLLIMCIYFLQPFFSIWTIYKLYSVVCLIASFSYLITSKRKDILKIIFGIIFAIATIFLLTKGITKKKTLLSLNYFNTSFT